MAFCRTSNVGDSQAIPGIQAADLLATSVTRLAREARANGEWPGELHSLGSLVMPALLGDEPPLTGMLGHRDGIAKVLLPLFRDAGHMVSSPPDAEEAPQNHDV